MLKVSISQGIQPKYMFPTYIFLFPNANDVCKRQYFQSMFPIYIEPNLILDSEFFNFLKTNEKKRTVRYSHFLFVVRTA